jgi:hypothetical protein
MTDKEYIKQIKAIISAIKIGFDQDDTWYEIGDEKDWLKKFDYYGLVKEAKRRKIN